MALCPSAILMSALSLTIVLIDIYNGKHSYILIHSVLGTILSFLFFVLCNYGFETINWIAIGFIPGYILFTWLFSEKEEACDTCEEPKPLPKPIKPLVISEKQLNCPANPIQLETECGISRFT